MNSRVSYVSPPAPGPHHGKRLSPWRVIAGLAVVVVVAAGAVTGYRFLVADQARADVPAPWFAGYVDVTATPAYDFETPRHDEKRDVVLSFVVAAGADECTPSWGTAYSLDGAGDDLDLDRRIARLRQHGGDVVISFGGAANSELATVCADVDTLREAYADVVDRYVVASIDLDIENDDLADRVAGLRRALAVADLQRERQASGHPLAVWLTLPVSERGLTDDGRAAVDQMLDAGVDLAGVNAMTMDYGTDLGGRSMADVSEHALTAVHDQLRDTYAHAGLSLSDATAWAKVGATPMIGQNDVEQEVFGLDDARQLNTFAVAQGLGRLSMWSLNRDRTCGENYADVRVVSDACSGVEQGDATFAALLGAGFTASAPATDVAMPTPVSPAPTDDPARSPYPVWASASTYLAGTKVVWHGTVYEARWWTRGAQPDDPTVAASDSPWTIIGPVLVGESPQPQPTLPAGLLPAWDGAAVYTAGQCVELEGAAFQAKWWTQGDSPAAASTDPGVSPWMPVPAGRVGGDQAVC
ncbi:chitinase [Microbacterium sp. 1P10AE]|uniref:chitinase n=1 Tax=Microbacterium sp. 1P10AE TaxID=3132286 RepID=UPI00399FA52C